MKESTRSGDDVKASLHTEALKLADERDTIFTINDAERWMYKSQTMIRRLVEELDKQGSSIWDSTRRVYENCQCDSCKNKTTPQTKPLSDEEIDKVIDSFTNKYFNYHDFARAIEERHGIK